MPETNGHTKPAARPLPKGLFLDWYICEGDQPRQIATEDDLRNSMASWPQLKDRVAGYEVSTVFLGLDHGHDDGDPVLWETMIFGQGTDGAGEYEDWQNRYRSARDARAGHRAAILMVQNHTEG